MNENIATIIIAYNPTLELVSNIQKIHKQLDKIVIFNNGDINNILSKIDNVIILGNGINLGIAEALNIGIKYAKILNIDYVITLDQDSILPDYYILNMISKYKELEKYYKIGILSPHYIDKDSKMGTKHVFLNKFSFKRQLCCKNSILNASIPITSGSLYNISIFEKIGFFREEFFIDYVDTEFNLRAISNGYKLFVFCDIVLEHKLGEREQVKKLGIHFHPTNHNKIRKYYITRNRLQVIREYGIKMPSFLFFEIAAISLDLIRIVFAEHNSITKLKYICLGIKDFYKKKFGKLDE